MIDFRNDSENAFSPGSFSTTSSIRLSSLSFSMPMVSDFGLGLDATLDNADGCKLTGSFSWFVQSVLATFAFCTLMLKRLREPKDERRPWRIWFYDTSKQAFGAGLVHFANIFLADFQLSKTDGDPCTLYLINFLLDSTLGLILIYILVKISQCIVKWRGYKTLHFGEYGNPPRAEAWIGQCALYLLIILIVKILIILLIFLEIWDKMHSILVSHKQYLSRGPRIVLDVLIVPFVINGLMFWIVDNILMKHSKLKNAKRNAKLPMHVRYHKHKHQQLNGSESEVLISDGDDQERFSSSDEKVVRETLLHMSV